MCLYVECKTFCIANKKKYSESKNELKGFKRPKQIFPIKYYRIDIKTLCIPLKNNFFNQKKKLLRAK